MRPLLILVALLILLPRLAPLPAARALSQDAVGVAPGTVIAADTTRTICAAGCDFPSLVAARDWVYGRIVVGNAALTLRIADGVYDEADQIFITGETWKRVRIIGNVADPAAVVLNFPAAGGLPAFGITRGGGLDLIDGVTVNGVGARRDRTTWAAGANGAAFLVTGSGSHLRAGGHVVVNDFYYGVLADHGGSFRGEAGFTVNKAGDCSFLARFNGAIQCEGCRAHTAAHVFTNAYGEREALGWNFLAEAGGTFVIDGARGTDAEIGGVGALLNGKGWAHAVEVSGSNGPGATALARGVLDFSHSRSHHNKAGGIARKGELDVSASTFSDNAFDGLLADGGTIEGRAVTVRDNGGFGYRSVSRGYLRAFRSLGTTSGNAAGLSYVDPGDPCASPADTSCRPGSLIHID